MKFLPYEDVPLYIATDGSEGEYIFAESASLSVSQPLAVTRQVEDNLLQIHSYFNSAVLGESNSIASNACPQFQANSGCLVCLGPQNGSPQSLATSIHKIPSGTKVSFPNGKHLYFSGDIMPEGDDYYVSLVPKSGGWKLTPEESQNGYFEPIYNYAAGGPVEGTLDVSFYPNTGNLQHFFNITGLLNPAQHPPISEEKVTGFLGDFSFSDAYISSFGFSLSPNGISQATASFLVYGELKKDPSLSDNYYSSDLYTQQSIPHGETSKVIGHTSLGINHPVSFSYNISVNRSPRLVCPTVFDDDKGKVPIRVTKDSVTIGMSMEGDNIDPEILSDGFNGKRANLSVELRDLGYTNFTDNSEGFMHLFSCSGVVTSQSLSVSSNGYLNGSVEIMQSHS